MRLFQGLLRDLVAPLVLNLCISIKTIILFNINFSVASSVFKVQTVSETLKFKHYLVFYSYLLTNYESKKELYTHFVIR